MVHSDDRGLVLPPKVAPIQCIVLPIAAHKPGVVEKAQAIAAELSAAGIRCEIDLSEQSAGWKFNEWEMRGVPVRMEVGPRDIQSGQVTLVRRDTLEKGTAPIDGISRSVEALLGEVQRGLFEKAKAFRDARTYEATAFDELVSGVGEKKGFVRALWCAQRACEDAIKEKSGATTRNIVSGQEPISGTCVHCGAPAKVLMTFAKAY